ncbi:MAG: hypothetical protein ACKO37_10145, partial [Vampirovibrionales bacterium]
LNPFSVQHQPFNTSAPVSQATDTLGKVKGSVSGGMHAMGSGLERIGRYVQNRGYELGHWWQQGTSGVQANPWMIATSPFQPRTLAKGMAVGHGLEALLTHMHPSAETPTPPSKGISAPSNRAVTHTSPQKEEPQLSDTTRTQKQELVEGFSNTLKQLKAQGLTETEVQQEAQALMAQLPQAIQTKLQEGLQEEGLL